MTREEVQRDFLAQAGWGGAEVAHLAGDASFRTYFRLAHDGRQVVLMDAPPPEEDVRPFVAVASYLRAQGFSAPQIVAADVGRGFLLLEDLGDETFNRVISDKSDMERPLYEEAVDLLIALHRQPAPAQLRVEGTTAYTLPPYDLTVLLAEASLFSDWYLAEVGSERQPEPGQQLSRIMTPLLARVIAAPPVLTLRDYHVDNLMWLAERDGIERVGPLDFQDALAGHPAYDLVSLLRDARRDVPPALEDAMISRYLAAHPELPRDNFDFAYALLGAQRNAKIIGIFTRLWCRDGKPGYLSMIPHVWGLLERSLAHPELGGLKQWFDQNVPAVLRKGVLDGANPIKNPGEVK